MAIRERVVTRASARVSTSFGPEELELLDTMLHGVLAGRDVAYLTRHSAFASVRKKAKHMKRRSVEGAAERDRLKAERKGAM